MVWQVVEKPTNSIINEYFFEEDAQKIVDFQNKNKVWKNNGGVPFLCLKYNQNKCCQLLLNSVRRKYAQKLSPFYKQKNVANP